MHPNRQGNTVFIAIMETDQQGNNVARALKIAQVLPWFRRQDPLAVLA